MGIDNEIDPIPIVKKLNSFKYAKCSVPMPVIGLFRFRHLSTMTAASLIAMQGCTKFLTHILYILVCFMSEKKSSISPGFTPWNHFLYGPGCLENFYFWNLSGATPFGGPLKFWPILHSKMVILGYFQVTIEHTSRRHWEVQSMPKCHLSSILQL